MDLNSFLRSDPLWRALHGGTRQARSCSSPAAMPSKFTSSATHSAPAPPTGIGHVSEAEWASEPAAQSGRGVDGLDKHRNSPLPTAAARTWLSSASRRLMIFRRKDAAANRYNLALLLLTLAVIPLFYASIWLSRLHLLRLMAWSRGWLTETLSAGSEGQRPGPPCRNR